MNYKLAAHLLFNYLHKIYQIKLDEVDIRDYKQIMKSLTKYLVNYENIYTTTDLKINIKFKKIISEDEPQLRSIITNKEFSKTNLNFKFPDIYIFDDGEVHFEGYVYTNPNKNSIFKHKSLEEIKSLEGVSNIILTKNNEILTIDKLIVNKEFINSGYGVEKVKVLPGDWIIFKDNIFYTMDYNYAMDHNIKGYLDKNQIGSKNYLYPETLFSKDLVEAAAKWWAQYLPGVKKVNFEKINQNVRDERDIYKANINMNEINRKRCISIEQYQDFIGILSDKIYKMEIWSYYGFPYYVKIGDSSLFTPPLIIDDTLKECNLGISSFRLFPNKTEMRIYCNGQINVASKVIYTTSNVNLYSKNNLDFENAPYMIFKGGNFKLLEIKLKNIKGELYIKTGGKIAKYNDNLGNNCNQLFEKGLVKLYLTLEKRDFKNTTKQAEEFSSQELIEILQNPQAIKEIFAENACLYYEFKQENPPKETTFYTIGKVQPELLSSDWYQYSTGPVKVIQILHKGTIHKHDIVQLEPGDFLLARNNNENLDFYPESFKKMGFAGYFCDEAGNVISEAPYYPGEFFVELAGLV